MSVDEPHFDYDYLIVGQGLAGTTLAMHLIRLGKRICVVNDSELPSSTKVAAGIFNPLTGKKLTKTWLADDIFPFARQFYAQMEQLLSARLVYEMPIFRPFRSIEEQNNFMARTAEPGVAPYIVSESDLSNPPDHFNSDFGGLFVKQSGWVDLPLFLDKSRQFLQNNGCFSEKRFSANDLTFNKTSVHWEGLTFGSAILCQGFQATKNHFFDWLPFAPVKGEMLEVATGQPLSPYIVNQGVFVLPVSERLCRVGATYSWHDLSWDNTDQAREELDSKFRQLYLEGYEIQNQTAGVRPSSGDRRPFVGMHPEFDRLGIFNGLGTKGVTLAPFFSSQLADHLENGKELNKQVNINRYFSLYFR
jgi:glycine/D-amino acid oxidase-like deaminating enzyme